MQILNFSINLDKIDKSKIVKGQKGKYYNITAFVSDEEDQFGNNVSVITSQTKEEREAKEERSYLGNGKVAYDSNGGGSTSNASNSLNEENEDDLPF